MGGWTAGWTNRLKKQQQQKEGGEGTKEEGREEEKNIYQFLKVVLPSDGTNYFLVPSLCPWHFWFFYNKHDDFLKVFKLNWCW